MAIGGDRIEIPNSMPGEEMLLWNRQALIEEVNKSALAHPRDLVRMTKEGHIVSNDGDPDKNVKPVSRMTKMQVLQECRRFCCAVSMSNVDLPTISKRECSVYKQRKFIPDIVHTLDGTIDFYYKNPKPLLIVSKYVMDSDPAYDLDKKVDVEKKRLTLLRELLAKEAAKGLEWEATPSTSKVKVHQKEKKLIPKNKNTKGNTNKCQKIRAIGGMSYGLLSFAQAGWLLSEVTTNIRPAFYFNDDKGEKIAPLITFSIEKDPQTDDYKVFPNFVPMYPVTAWRSHSPDEYLTRTETDKLKSMALLLQTTKSQVRENIGFSQALAGLFKKGDKLGKSDKADKSDKTEKGKTSSVPICTLGGINESDASSESDTD